MKPTVKRICRNPVLRALIAISFLLTRPGLPAYVEASAQIATTRATLPNGLQVVIVRDPIAPAVTVELSVLAGGSESPREYPGMAHAQEHMAFRGCPGMTSDQIASLYSQLGGQDNADTEQEATHYYATVPSADLEVALRAQAACATDINDSEDEWEQERGAIEEEVAEDVSDPWYRLGERVDEDMFQGTPYAQDSLGTKESFDKLTAGMLKDFQQKWYAPNNMILVITGNVDPTGTLPKVRQIFGTIAARSLPERPAVVLKPVKSESFTMESDLPNVVGVIAYRFPGHDSPDYAAARVLTDVLSSRRAELYKLERSGKVSASDFQFVETRAKASVVYAEIEVPSGRDSSEAMRELKRALQKYLERGVPADLVEAAKRNELSSAEFEKTSISGLADTWSYALANEKRSSPDEDIEALRKVTAADVNRVAKRYLAASNSVTGLLYPAFDSSPVAEKRATGGKETPVVTARSAELPDWASSALSDLTIPADMPATADMRLANGIRLIVRTDRTSPTVRLRGSVKSIVEAQAASSNGYVSALLNGLFDYGTRRMANNAFQKALDDIGADERAGYDFSLDVLKENFADGVKLLAENELDPTLRSKDFRLAKKQLLEDVASSYRDPEFRSKQALALALLPPNDPELSAFGPHEFAKADVDAVRQYLAKTMRPDLTTMVIVGDISPDEARRVIEHWFGAWHAIGPTPLTILPAVPLNKASSIRISDPGSEEDSVTLAEQIRLDRLDPAYYPLQLGSMILGGGFEGSRLYRDLRQVSGYVYSVNLSLDSVEKRATYSVSFGCDPGNTDKARAIIDRDIAEMQMNDVSEEELKQAKAYLLRQIPLDESSQEDVAVGLLNRAEAGLPLDEPLREARQFLNVDAEQIRTAFAQRVRPHEFVQVTRGPGETAASR
jgi:zinc protease